jgi:hypothetical protein
MVSLRSHTRLATVAAVAFASLLTFGARPSHAQEKPAKPAAGTPKPATGAPGAPKPATGAPTPPAATTPPAGAATTPPPGTGTPAATPGATPAAPGTPVASTEATSSEAAPPGIRLRKLEQRVQELKEQAWRIKARVGMLKEAVLGGGIGARASIKHENKMGGSFRLVKVLYALDGTQIYSKADDTGKLDELKTFDVLSGPIAPGNHTLSVLIVYRGWGFGVFEYLKKYKFTVRSSHTFTVAEGKLTDITVVGYERGGATTPMEKRPAVDFKVNVVSEAPSPKAQ